MVNFATLKKSSSNLDRLTKELEKINAPQTTERKEDTRFWKLERDKSGNGSAVIRFLPSPPVDGDDGLPWVRVFNHGFKGPTGKWYIENSLTTLNQKDPVSEFNSELWGDRSITDPTYRSSERKQARDQKRRLTYISNILVVADPKHPENEGKVFLFKFGKKIFDKINLLMNPEFEGDDPVNPFDLWKGANLKLRMRTVDGYPNYDQSVFESSAPIDGTDAELEKIWKSEYSLKEFLDTKNFKTYDELKKKLTDVLGTTETSPVKTTSVPTKKSATPAPKKAAVVDEEDETPPFDTDEEDDDLKAFKALAD